MFRISRFQELLKGVPRGTFDGLVREHAADKHSKGFGCWDQLVAMLYGQFSASGSLRELCDGLNSQHTHHYHLGTRHISRSTLSDANTKRSSAVYAGLAQTLMTRAGRSVRRETRDLLYLIDSTTLTLKGRGFDWTEASRTRCGQGLKLHLMLAADGALPLHQQMTPTNVNDRDAAVTFPLESNVTYVFDKAYCDYAWWHRIGVSGATFVTRFKRNAALTVAETRPIAASDRDTILADEVVGLKHRYARGGRPASPPLTLRRIIVARPDKDTPLVLATNDLERPAADIAQAYKTRWQIELFFKWIKQHLKIKRFLGRSENAVRVQVMCALIAYLLLEIYRQTHGIRTSLWTLLGEVRATLFQRPGVDAALYRRRRERAEEMAARQGVLNV